MTIPSIFSKNNDSRVSRYLPILEWGRRYNGETFTSDLLAGIIVAIMLIP